LPPLFANPQLDGSPGNDAGDLDGNSYGVGLDDLTDDVTGDDLAHDLGVDGAGDGDLLADRLDVDGSLIFVRVVFGCGFE